MTTKPKITIKEAKLIKGIVAGKTKRQAAMEAFDVERIETAAVMASHALRKVNVQQALEEAMKKHGIDLDSAIAPIGKALKAKRIQITGSGDQMFTEEVEDVEMQLKGSDRALKLMNIGQNRDGGSIHFHQHVNEKQDDYKL